jgi:spermidine synthase
MPLLIAGCFFLSGLAGLIYEVVWARQLGLFLGITAYAHTAVITAYMAGLAAGSFYFGRHADRHPRPLIVYAWLEIGVGLYAAITPWLFTFLQTAYTGTVDVAGIGALSGHLSRFVIALVALLVPTFLMGGTLPLLVRGFTTELPALGRMTSRLYGINTLGAMSGTLLAGFLLLPGIGVTATIFVGVVINLGIAAFVLSIPRRHADDAHEEEPATTGRLVPEQHLPARSRIVALIAFAAAGFAALLTQMAWIRALILVVGGSVYAFAITLASFLAGIGLGSLLYARYLAIPGAWLTRPPMRERMVQAALLAILISLTLLLGLPLIGKLPTWFLAGYSAGLKDSFPLFQLFIFALCFSVMIAPTVFMGALFPLVTVIWTRSVDQVGRGVGLAYAVNTCGTILGALLGGLFILPWLGVHDSIRLAAGLYFLVAAGFWLFSTVSVGRGFRQTTVALAAPALAAIAWLIPPWDKAMMVSGVFSRPDNMNFAMKQQPGKGLKQIIEDYELLYYEEGPDATVAVRRKKDSVTSQRTLVINGKADASSFGDIPTQILLAQLPLALSPQAESALVIGLGSGITAGSLATSESLKNLTILEISDEVVEASAFFEPENYSVLNDARVRLVTADARNYLMASPDRFDLIVSEPSNPWISGIANLFTDEFLQLARSRLQPGGIMTQWFHVYSMSDADLKTMLKTFDDNFEYVSVWKIQAGDLALIGSDKPHALSLFYASQSGAEEFARAQVRSGRDLASLYIFGGDALSRYVVDARTNSDVTPVIEFNAPRHLYSQTENENIDNIFAYLQGRQQAVPMTEMVHQSGDHLDAPFMSLSIAGNGSTPRQVGANWMIDRPSVVINGVSVAGLGSERILSWTEDASRFQIRAVLRTKTDRGDSLQDLLDQLTRSTGRKGGTIELADGTKAIWLSNATGGSGPLRLDVAWDCPAPGLAFSRYALRASLPDPGADARREALARLVGRISCVSPG